MIVPLWRYWNPLGDKLSRIHQTNDLCNTDNFKKMFWNALRMPNDCSAIIASVKVASDHDD
jgi:hypothetical protein